jgi:hypothetical protein
MIVLKRHNGSILRSQMQTTPNTISKIPKIDNLTLKSSMRNQHLISKTV